MKEMQTLTSSHIVVKSLSYFIKLYIRIDFFLNSHIIAFLQYIHKHIDNVNTITVKEQK